MKVRQDIRVDKKIRSLSERNQARIYPSYSAFATRRGSKAEQEGYILKTTPPLADTNMSCFSIVRVIELLKDYGFALRMPYLKKLTGKIWELRAGRWRLLFGVVDNTVVITNIFLKTTQKTPKKAITVAVKRLENLYEK